MSLSTNHVYYWININYVRTTKQRKQLPCSKIEASWNQYPNPLSWCLLRTTKQDLLSLCMAFCSILTFSSNSPCYFSSFSLIYLCSNLYTSHSSTLPRLFHSYLYWAVSKQVNSSLPFFYPDSKWKILLTSRISTSSSPVTFFLCENSFVWITVYCTADTAQLQKWCWKSNSEYRELKRKKRMKH